MGKGEDPVAEKVKGRAVGVAESAGERAVRKELPRAGEGGAALQQTNVSVRNVGRRRRTNPASLVLI